MSSLVLIVETSCVRCNLTDWRKDYRKDMREGTGEAPWTLWRVFVWVMLPIIGISVLLGGIGWGLGIMSQPSAIVAKTVDADNAIYNYEWFHRKYGDIQALDAQIVAAEETLAAFEESAGPRDGWKHGDREEHSRLSSVVLGLKTTRASAVAEYNAKSGMVNRAIFKDGDLPEHIEL